MFLNLYKVRKNKLGHKIAPWSTPLKCGWKVETMTIYYLSSVSISKTFT